jgi:hypothetical protein
MIIDVLAKDYRESTEYFLESASTVAPDSLDLCEPGEWSARQVIHHMADSEAQSYARLRRLVAEPNGSSIQGYDEAAWAECSTLGYEQLPVENALQVIRAVRSSSLDIIYRLAADDLDRFGVHSESGPYSVSTWIETYIAHPRDHAEQLSRAVSSGLHAKSKSQEF